MLYNVELVLTDVLKGEAKELSKHLLKKNVLIDLAADFRLKKPKD